MVSTWDSSGAAWNHSVKQQVSPLHIAVLEGDLGDKREHGCFVPAGCKALSIGRWWPGAFGTPAQFHAAANISMLSQESQLAHAANIPLGGTIHALSPSAIQEPLGSLSCWHSVISACSLLPSVSHA